MAILLSLSYKLAELPQVAAQILPLLQAHRKWVLEAEMGAGKTTLAAAICRALGSRDEASSPTFALINRYDLPQGQWLHHLDLYRLQSTEEALALGIEDILYDQGYALIEWPGLIEAYLPAGCLRLRLSPGANPDERHLVLEEIAF